ncbi:hypothetical protein RRG08_003068 [Elysia crispata]|uniref:Uncharacterized protein n=1 Tax=Elysia crispata TaxID=231223 RepID=A0AAE1B854_9GAST|nr:hypothetical protein RRG08_003068 [Elysia crispata]
MNKNAVYLALYHHLHLLQSDKNGACPSPSAQPVILCRRVRCFPQVKICKEKLNSSTADPPIEEREDGKDKDQFHSTEGELAFDEEVGSPFPELIDNFISDRFKKKD